MTKQLTFRIYLLVLCFPIGLMAQEQPDYVLPPNANYVLSGSYQHASLYGWAQRSEMQMLNRSSNPYGIVTDRGWMYNYTNRMFDEYQINKMTFSPTLADDYLFYRSPNAVRFVAGDYDDLEIYTNAEIRLQVELMPRHTVKIWGYSEHNTVLTRGFMNVAYQYKIFEHFQAGVRHTFGSSKMDLDISMFGQWGNEQTGMLKLDLTLMDYLNNYTEDRVSTFNYVQDTLRYFTTQPRMIQFAAISPLWKNLRGELVAAYQLDAQSDIMSTANRQEEYGYSHGGYFAGGLVEYQFPYITLGSMYKIMHSNSARDTSGTTGIVVNYESNQTEIRQGFYSVVTASQVTWESWFWLINYEEMQDGTQFSVLAEIDKKFLHKETRYLLHNRLWIRPDYKGLLIGFEHLADLRKKKISIPNATQNDFIPNGLDPMAVAYPEAYHLNNNRIVFTVGFQFHPRAFVQVAYSLDLDLDYHRIPGGERYDTAYLRMEYRW